MGAVPLVTGKAAEGKVKPKPKVDRKHSMGWVLRELAPFLPSGALCLALQPLVAALFSPSASAVADDLKRWSKGPDRRQKPVSGVEQRGFHGEGA